MRLKFPDDPVEAGIKTAICLLLLLLVWAVVGTGFFLKGESECLALGYRSANTDYAFNVYCVTRVDQTDVVVPLEEARKKVRR